MSSLRPQVPNSPPIPRSASASKPPNPNPQTQSPFLQRLPAELRNQIYTLVFTPTPTNTSSPPVPLHNRPPHPLTLLQTCRLIHHEAHLLAFTTHTFSLHADAYPDPPRSQGSTDYQRMLIPQGIQSRTSLLSCTHRCGIKSLTLHHGSGNHTTSVLSWLLSTLPSLSHIVLLTTPNTHSLCPRSRTPDQETDLLRFRAHNQSLPLPPQDIGTYAPPVLVETCHALANGAQHGPRWLTHWPQLESAACYTQLSCSDGGRVREELVMDEDSVDEDLGIRMCGCDGEPRHVVWTKARLVQAGLAQRTRDKTTTRTDLVVRDLETPRGVTVSVSEELPKPQVSVSPAQQRQPPLPSTVLVPGAVPLSLSEVVIAGGGGGFEGSEEYWERLRQRQRQGNLGAIVRGWWRSAMAPSQENVSYAKLTR